MYLKVEEVANYLGVTTKWVQERLSRGDSGLSRHLKCRRDEADLPEPSHDRAPVRIGAEDLALYVLRNTRPDGLARYPERVDEDALAAKRDEIREFVSWYRTDPGKADGGPLVDAAHA